MIVVDTNLLARFLVGDDADQACRAEAVLRGGPIRLLRTVLLELEWVLRSRYRLPPARIAGGMRRLLGLPGIEVEAAPEVDRALAWFAAGLDFADAMHLAATREHESFVSFDRDLARGASRIDGTPPVREP